jgi:hypothetical protein
LPPVDLRAVCFVRAITLPKVKYSSPSSKKAGKSIVLECCGSARIAVVILKESSPDEQGG